MIEICWHDQRGTAIAALMARSECSYAQQCGALAPTPTLTLLAGAGTSGSDRLELTWNDRAITNQWLRVTLKADAHTGLSQDDLFYFGSLPGESNSDANVGFADLVKVAQNYGKTTTGGIAGGDSNLDGQVNFADLVQIAQNYGKSLAPLSLAAAVPAPLPGQIVSSVTSAVAHKAAAITSSPATSAKPASTQKSVPAKPVPTSPPLPPKLPAALKLSPGQSLFATTLIKNRTSRKNRISKTGFRV